MKDILHNIVIALIFAAAAIIGAVLAAVLTAFIAANITDNVNTIVISCLISVWIAELIIIILRNRITYNRKIKAINIDDTEKLNTERKKLKTRYLFLTIISSLAIAYVLYNMKGQLINSLNGTGESIQPNITGSPVFYIRIIIAAALIIVVIVKGRYRSKNTNK